MAKILKRPATTWDNLPPILDAPAVAMLLGVTIETVWRMARKKQIPAHKVGTKLWRFYKADLMAFADKKSAAE